jgi:hypothetical protein
VAKDGGLSHHVAVQNNAFVLVHSPLVGPRTWARVAEALTAQGRRAIVPSLRLADVAHQPYWSQFVDQVIEAVDSELQAVTLVGHSGAGPLLPVIGEQLPMEIDCYVFVDATIPAPTGSTRIVPPAFMDALRDLAKNGRVPKWSSWWGEDAMRSLLPDDDLRRQIEEELPSLPLAYFEEAVPTPPWWPEGRCSYVRFSEAYQGAATDAESREWPVVRLAGGHLHMLVDPLAVAHALLTLAGASR